MGLVPTTVAQAAGNYQNQKHPSVRLVRRRLGAVVFVRTTGVFASTGGARFIAFAARSLDLLQRAAQRFDLAFVGNFLTIGQFDEFEDFLHLIERELEGLDDFVDVFDRAGDGGVRRGLKLRVAWFTRFTRFTCDGDGALRTCGPLGALGPFPRDFAHRLRLDFGGRVDFGGRNRRRIRVRGFRAANRRHACRTAAASASTAASTPARRAGGRSG
ncbi:MAG: hypothetical protein EXS35_09540 [Pedosphaera sp.]|nr:hypothetical protein [Pedosphaera sp.]